MLIHIKLLIHKVHFARHEGATVLLDAHKKPDSNTEALVAFEKLLLERSKGFRLVSQARILRGRDVQKHR